MKSMICFICKTPFKEVNFLVKHLKKEHDLKTNSTFRCYDISCSQVFKNLSSYKKHIRKHLNLNSSVGKNNLFSESVQENVDSEQTIRNHTSSEIPQIDKTNFPKSVEKDEPEFDISNLNEVFQMLSKNYIQFLISLHANNNFTRKDVLKIKESVENSLIQPILQVFKDYFLKRLGCNSIILNEISSLIAKFHNIFEECRSEHLLIKKLKSIDCMNDVKEFIICSEVDSGHRNGEFSYYEKEVKGSVLPLRSQFKKTFEKESVLSNTLQQMNYLQNSKHFTNFVQGPLWKQKTDLYPGKILIPYFLYADDLEINNALGSHSTIHSVCNFYYSFPCFPSSKNQINNIFLAAVVKSQDLKSYGNEKCLKPLVDELIFLENVGVDIKVSNEQNYHVHFVLGLLIGDNLGLNSLLSLNKSFSGVFCRFCKVSKSQSNTLYSEKFELMRNVENYNSDVDEANPKLTGIKSVCIFNEIRSFHVVNNFCVDAMHDVFEGICHYDLCNIIKYFIQTMQYFSLELLNMRKQTFEYGAIEIDNTSPNITWAHLNNRHLKMSAREMLTFVIHFPLMVGDLVPDNDEVWKFLLNLIQMIDHIMCFEINDTVIATLKSQIEFHNKEYVRIFKDNLKPKFHILTHYPTVLKNSGPVRKFWCFQYEAKHKQFKLYSHAITSRKNICLSLAKKFQYLFADYVLNFSHSSINYYLDEKNEIECNFDSIVKHKLKVNENSIKYFEKIEYNGIKFKKNYYVAQYCNDYIIHKILNIVKFEDNVFLFCQQLKKVVYCPHLLAFEVDSSVLGEYFIVRFEKIVGPPVTLIKTANGKCMLRIKEYYLP